jgi:hypothetical protein
MASAAAVATRKVPATWSAEMRLSMPRKLTVLSSGMAASGSSSSSAAVATPLIARRSRTVFRYCSVDRR